MENENWVQLRLRKDWKVDWEKSVEPRAFQLNLKRNLLGTQIGRCPSVVKFVFRRGEWHLRIGPTLSRYTMPLEELESLVEICKLLNEKRAKGIV